MKGEIKINLADELHNDIYETGFADGLLQAMNEITARLDGTRVEV